MNISFRTIKSRTCRIMVVACVAALACAARAEAFSDTPQAQTSSGAAASRLAQSSNPAVITDNSRDPLFYDDFMRITFLPQFG